MTLELPVLPIGTPSFEDLRLENELYVDKTKYLPGLRKAGKVIFCSRPRRFGKSLTVSALNAFYSGRKELFQGLEAEKFLNSKNFIPRPVIHLDMSAAAGSASKEILEGKIKKQLKTNAELYNINLDGLDAAGDFLDLIQKITKTGSKTKAVILIDEYDCPVIEAIGKPDLLEETRQILRNFYSQIKTGGNCLHFTFITGVSKFSRMGVFSTLNNLTDISLEPRFGAFMGLTQEELEKNFQPFISQRARDFGLSVNELLELIKLHYDGFSFDGVTKLYNPFSTLKFFNSELNEFLHYWFESGSNTIIRKFLKNKGLTVDEFKGLAIDINFASSPGEIEETPPHGFLYQTGYLSLFKKDNGSYFLNYPNFEVLSAISRLFISNFVPSDSETSQGMMDLRQHLADGDVSKTVDNLRRMYACLSNYDRYSADKDLSESLKKEIRLKLADNFKTELRRMLSENFAPGFLSELGENVIELIPIDSDHNKHINNKIRENFMDLIRRKLSGSFKEDIGKKLGEMFEELFRRMFNGSLLDLIRLKLGENFYRSVLQAYLRGLEVMALPELESGLGRPDLVVKYKGRTYVFEIKTADNAAQAAQAAVIGMDQIRDRGYSEPYENPILVSLAVDKQRRNIGACIFEKDGEVSVIDIYK